MPAYWRIYVQKKAVPALQSSPKLWRLMTTRSKGLPSRRAFSQKGNFELFFRSCTVSTPASLLSSSLIPLVSATFKAPKAAPASTAAPKRIFTIGGPLHSRQSTLMPNSTKDNSISFTTPLMCADSCSQDQHGLAPAETKVADHANTGEEALLRCSGWQYITYSPRGGAHFFLGLSLGLEDSP